MSVQKEGEQRGKKGNEVKQVGPSTISPGDNKDQEELVSYLEDVETYLKSLEQSVAKIMNQDPDAPKTEGERAGAYFKAEMKRIELVGRQAVASYVNTRRRYVREGKDPELIEALDRKYSREHNILDRFEQLRKVLHMRAPAPRSLPRVVMASMRNVAMVIWIITALPLCFAAALLRIIHPPLRALGFRNGNLPLDLFQQYLACTILTILGVTVKYKGLRFIQDVKKNGTGTIGMFKHTSNLDPILVTAGPLAFKWVGKRVLFMVPIFGWIMRLYGHIPIDRKNLARAKEAINTEIAAKIRRWGRSIAISPEGTRSRSGRLTDFKKGPFHLAHNVQLPITPIHVEGAWALNPPGSMLIYPGTVRVEFLPSVAVETATVEELLVEVRKRMLLRTTQEIEESDGKEKEKGSHDCSLSYDHEADLSGLKAKAMLAMPLVFIVAVRWLLRVSF
mmetsp:Transcript_13148/g.18188  ORF Transcript_13148/g.18188 Transcript_13148/m.18188 type:complete len:449 (-) Transcript_13148:220-1566(-)